MAPSRKGQHPPSSTWPGPLLAAQEHGRRKDGHIQRACVCASRRKDGPGAHGSQEPRTKGSWVSQGFVCCSHGPVPLGTETEMALGLSRNVAEHGAELNTHRTQLDTHQPSLSEPRSASRGPRAQVLRWPSGTGSAFRPGASYPGPPRTACNPKSIASRPASPCWRSARTFWKQHCQELSPHRVSSTCQEIAARAHRAGVSCQAPAWATSRGAAPRHSPRHVLFQG